MVKLETLGNYYYKYQPIDKYPLKNLAESQLYFSNPADFNDPFDSIVEYYFGGTEKQWVNYLGRMGWKNNLARKFIKEQLELNIFIRKGSEIIRDEFKIQSDIPKHGSFSKEDISRVCCFSKKNDNILLWSHYADNHKGFCLMYKSS